MGSPLTPEQVVQITANHQQGLQAAGAVNRCSHDANRELWEAASEKAKALNLNIRHNATCRVGWIGVHNYVVFVPGMGWAINSKGCVASWGAPYSRWCRPSISGESSCIQLMIEFLDGMTGEGV